mgnify:FL=1
MDTPTPANGFVVGSWPRTMLVIPVPEHYRFEAPSITGLRMYHATIVGPHTAPIISYNDGPRNRGLSIELSTLGAYQILGIDQSELTNRMINAEELLPRDLVMRMIEAVRETSDPARICLRVEALLLSFLAGRELSTIHPAVRAALTAVRCAPEANIEEMALRCNMSPRTLRRLFGRFVGLPPKRVSLIHRSHCAARRIIKNDMLGRRQNLADLAQELGFHDHAHLSHVLQQELLAAPSVLPRSDRHGEVRVVLRPSLYFTP